MSVRASITAEIDARMPRLRGKWWGSVRRVMVAQKPVNGSMVRITLPKGPKSDATITVEVELADLHAICRELSRVVQP